MFRTASRPRIDWPTVRDRTDLVAVATVLLDGPPKRIGSRLVWRCPFHDDHDPSLQVDPAKRRRKCWPCNLGGDAVELVKRCLGIGFPEAMRWLAELAGIAVPSMLPARPVRPGRVTPAGRPVRPSVRPPMPTAGRPPVRAAGSPPDEPKGLPPADALALVTEAEKRLWSPEGRTAMTYLKGRGLTPETVRRHRLGWTPRAMLPTSDGARPHWSASGIVVPWHDGGRLCRVKIRQADGREPRYAQAFSDGPALFPGPRRSGPGCR